MAHKLELSEVSTRQLLSMAEGLEERGEWGPAYQLYRLAMRQASPQQRAFILLRLGSTGGKRTAPLREVERAARKIGADVFVGAGLATWHKILPFAEDPRFMELADKHARLLPLPNWHWNLQTVLWAVQRAKALDGDLVELGVFKGHTTIFCAEYVGFADWPKRWWLYDTFEGVPEDQLDPGWEDVNRRTYTGVFSYEEVRDRFAHIPNIDVIQGRVPEILAEKSPEKIAFIHMDLNNSTAEIQALEALYDRLTPGGVIVFDDYGWTVAHAQHDAEKAWFAERGLAILTLPTGQGLFVKPPA